MHFDEIGGGGPQIFGLPVDRDLMFSNHKGISKNRIEKRQRKLIVKLPFLKPFLRRGEKLVLITTCYSPLGSLGQYLTAFLFVYLKRSLLVFTNLRIFHIPTTPAYNYRQTLAQVEYAGCRGLRFRGGSLYIEHGRLNKVERFGNIGLGERPKLRALLGSHLSPGGPKAETSDRTHLCPQCTRELTPARFRCGHCQLKFKSKLAAILAAVLLPGGGYFFTRHYLLGFLSGAVEVFLLLYCGTSFQDALQGVQGSIAYAAVTAAIYLLFKTITVIHSTEFVREFIPTKTNFEVRPL